VILMPLAFAEPPQVINVHGPKTKWRIFLLVAATWTGSLIARCPL
jgi:hypothetical protein